MCGLFTSFFGYTGALVVAAKGNTGPEEQLHLQAHSSLHQHSFLINQTKDDVIGAVVKLRVLPLT